MSSNPLPAGGAVGRGVGLVCGGAMVAIGHLAEELDALSRNLRTMAANYEAADPQAQRTYRATRRDYSTTLGPQ